MAFSPFSWFRKKQKTLLAVLTIFCMVIFVFTGGFGKGADVLDQIIYLFGGTVGHGSHTPVLKLYGKTITEGELDELRLTRQMVNEFMLYEVDHMSGVIDPEIMRIQSRLSDLQQKQLQQVVRERMMRLFQLRQAPPAQRALYATYLQIREKIFSAVNILGTIHNSLINDHKTDEAQVIEQLTQSLIVEDWLWDRSAREFYFGGTNRLDDLLDFLIWKNQADRLGIVLTRSDVCKAVNHETFGQETLTGDAAKDQEKMRTIFRGSYSGISIETLYNALTDEFRVLFAQAALLGYEPGARGYRGFAFVGAPIPAVATPAEFWQFFRENRSVLKVAMLPVPVKSFDSATVGGEPTEKELRSLYHRFKNYEPMPQRSKPGFKTPRLIQVEWVSARVDAPLFQRRAVEVARLMPAVLRLDFDAGAAGIGGGLMALASYAARTVDPKIFEPSLLADYGRYWESQTWVSYDSALYETGEKNPEHVAVLATQLMSNVGTGILPWPALGGLKGAETIQQARQSARVASIVLAGSNPTLLDTITEQAGATHVNVRTFEQQHAQLVEKLHQELAQMLASGSLHQFQKELNARRHDPAEVKAWIAKSLLDYGIQRHELMKKPESQYDIGDDATLAPLRKIYLRQRPSDPLGKTFSTLFFSDLQGMYSGLPWPSSGFNTPDKNPAWPTDLRWEAEEEKFLYWKIEDKPAVVPSFEEAKPRVIAAWHYQKARELARKEAERLQAELKTRIAQGSDAERFLRDEAAKHKGWGEVFELSDVAKLQENFPSFRADAPRDYTAYKVPEEMIAYPRHDLIDQLLSLKKVGDSIVVADQPEKHFYVTALLSRVEPSEDRFYSVYRGAARGLGFGDTLWSRLQMTKQDQFRQQLMMQLRSDATTSVDSDGYYDLDSSVRKRFEGRGDSE